ncbi:MAG: GerMN domain-containing protein [Oscillospiraceae bacterium]|nr:GerMN domain-containing protein [Oscillospiraceae bacterium]
MRKLIPLFLSLCLLFGCAPSPESGRAVRNVYCTTADALLAPQEVAIGVLEQHAEIERIFLLLNELQFSEFCDALRLESFSLMEDTLTLQLSSEYDSLTGLSRTLCDGALALTYCDLPYVNSVILRTDSFESEPLSSDTFLLSLPTHSNERDCNFYFVKDGVLSEETRTIPYQKEDVFLKNVTEALLLGPQTEGLTASIPSGTHLNGIRLEDNVCTVDLSAEFLALPSHTEEEERLCLFSLVNTVAHASGAEQVQILIDGESRTGFTHYDLTQAIQPELFD